MMLFADRLIVDDLVMAIKIVLAAASLLLIQSNISENVAAPDWFCLC
jgi:hypothetical protein